MILNRFDSKIKYFVVCESVLYLEEYDMSYVCSDIHGLWDRYARMKMYTQEENVYILGDVIDHGPDGIKIIKDIMETPRIHLLLGNHEHMMMRALYHNDIRALHQWIKEENGGVITKDAFCKESLESQEEILNYLNNCYITKNVIENDVSFALTHSGPARLNLLYNKSNSQDKELALWYSPYCDDAYVSLESYNNEHIWIIGHIPVQTLFNDPLQEFKAVSLQNIIDIDCGCEYQSKENSGMDNSLAVFNMKNYVFEYIR